MTVAEFNRVVNEREYTHDFGPPVIWANGRPHDQIDEDTTVVLDGTFTRQELLFIAAVMGS